MPWTEPWKRVMLAKQAASINELREELREARFKVSMAEERMGKALDALEELTDFPTAQAVRDHLNESGVGVDWRGKGD